MLYFDLNAMAPGLPTHKAFVQVTECCLTTFPVGVDMQNDSITSEYLASA